MVSTYWIENIMEEDFKTLFCATAPEFAWRYWGNLRKILVRVDGLQVGV
jgi:hypothetical protein